MAQITIRLTDTEQIEGAEGHLKVEFEGDILPLNELDENSPMRR